MAMYANGNESPTLRTYVSDETKVSFLNVSTFKSAQVPWTYFFSLAGVRKRQDIDLYLWEFPINLPHHSLALIDFGTWYNVNI